MDFDFRAYNARVDEAQSFQPGTREFAERVRREGEEAKNSAAVSSRYRGLGYSKRCDECSGTGEIETGWLFKSCKPCPECAGQGTLWVRLL